MVRERFAPIADLADGHSNLSRMVLTSRWWRQQKCSKSALSSGPTTFSAGSFGAGELGQGDGQPSRRQVPAAILFTLVLVDTVDSQRGPA
jgi:hypothetical protein